MAGKLVRTSIFKSPVSGNVRVKTLNLEGDEQSDLSVHGGVHKAVYAYPSEHYRFWPRKYRESTYPWGYSEENFTTERGLLEEAVASATAFGLDLRSLSLLNLNCLCIQAWYPIRSPGMVKRFSAQRSDWILSCRPGRGTGYPWRRDRVDCSG